jgi:hypothetical protein
MGGRHRAPRPGSWPRRLLTAGLLLSAVVSMSLAFAPELAPATAPAASQLQVAPELAATTPPAQWTTTSEATTPVVAPNVVVIPLPTTVPPVATTTPPAAPESPPVAPRPTTPPPPVTSLSPSQPKPPPPVGTACPSSGFDGVKAHVARVGWHLIGAFDLSPGRVLGVAGRAGPSDHPLGLALDLMVGSKELGDGIADYVLERRALFAVKYVIWHQRINHGDGWVPMEDRGGVTANHFDHVHVSFNGTGSNGLITC